MRRTPRAGWSMGGALAVVLLVSALPADAQIPETITYQGRLASSHGDLVNATLAITFRIYESRQAAIAQALWTETQSVTVTNGDFTVELGSIEPFAAHGVVFDRPYFLGLQVSGDTEMTPRQPFSTAGYALNAKRAENAGHSEHAATADPGAVGAPSIVAGA